MDAHSTRSRSLVGRMWTTFPQWPLGGKTSGGYRRYTPCTTIFGYDMHGLILASLHGGMTYLISNCRRLRKRSLSRILNRGFHGSLRSSMVSFFLDLVRTCKPSDTVATMCVGIPGRMARWKYIRIRWILFSFGIGYLSINQLRPSISWRVRAGETRGMIAY